MPIDFLFHINACNIDILGVVAVSITCNLVSIVSKGLVSKAQRNSEIFIRNRCKNCLVDFFYSCKVSCAVNLCEKLLTDESSAVVGSSAITRLAFTISTIAISTRWSIPPDSSKGKL